ncbi:MAG TPA: hypothetical protein V6C81_22935 [Planktothrix sp.]
MKNKTALTLLTSLALGLGFVAPSIADGPMGSAKSAAGATTAFLVDVPEGIVVDSLYRVPKKCWHTLAVALGDNPSSDFGLCYLGQQLVGITVGVPVGVVWGVPYGALHGAKHGIGSGWDKPFSSESYIVTEEK